MCLYGSDVDEETSPVEAGLSWVIGRAHFHYICCVIGAYEVDVGKERKEKGGFIGAENVMRHLKDGPPRRRVGLIVEGAPARRKNHTFSSSSFRNRLTLLFL